MQFLKYALPVCPTTCPESLSLIDQSSWEEMCDRRTDRLQEIAPSPTQYAHNSICQFFLPIPGLRPGIDNIFSILSSYAQPIFLVTYHLALWLSGLLDWVTDEILRSRVQFPVLEMDFFLSYLCSNKLYFWVKFWKSTVISHSNHQI